MPAKDLAKLTTGHIRNIIQVSHLTEGENNHPCTFILCDDNTVWVQRWRADSTNPVWPLS